MDRKITNLMRYAKIQKNLDLNPSVASMRKIKSFADMTSLKKSVFSNEKLLHTVQMSNVYKDSKTFVDMVTKYNENEVLSNFNKLGESPSMVDIKKFLDENFHEVGHDLIQADAKDWYENAPFLNKLTDQRLINFGSFLNSKWKMLLRNFDRSKICNDCDSTAIYSKNSFIVPGGRFIEYYYWDTYWCIEGLLSCGMVQTARGIIENFLDIVKTHGFVPNGSRVYYLNRSQPPLLTQMVEAYYRMTNDTKFVEEALQYLDQEYDYWMLRKSIKIVKHSEAFKLNWYRVKSNMPRPESYKEDYQNAMETGNKEYYFSNIMTATESGWDFSSRWFDDPLDIKTIQITSIIPVDLNSIMFKNESILLEFHKLINVSKEKIKFYEKAVKRREKAINTVLWNKKLLTWGDYNIKTKKLHNTYLYITDLSPLWSGVTPPSSPGVILERYKSLLYCHVSGIPASNILSHQQWDFPNVWAPYHYWIVDYLRLNGCRDDALNIAQRFVNTVYRGWVKTNYIFEKYAADKLGEYGGGGEYVVQEGFGWTNGVVIKFLEWFGDDIKIFEPEKENDNELIGEQCMKDLGHKTGEEKMKITPTTTITITEST